MSRCPVVARNIGHDELSAESGSCVPQTSRARRHHSLISNDNVELEVRGVPTTRDVSIEIVASEGFGTGSYSTSYLEEMEERLPALAQR